MHTQMNFHVEVVVVNTMEGTAQVEKLRWDATTDEIASVVAKMVRSSYNEMLRVVHPDNAKVKEYMDS